MKLLPLTIFALLSLSLSAQAITKEAVIKQAREYLGGDAKLNSIDSLSYKGTIEEMGEEETTTGQIYLRFERRFKQRMDTQAGDFETTMACNDFEGYAMRRSLETDMKQVRVLPAEQVARLRSMSAENLYFFEGPKKLGGEIEYMGEDSYEGNSVYKLKYTYPSGSGFIRNFDQQSFNLVATQPLGADNVTFVEEGEQVVDGIKFPEKVKTFVDGELVRVVTFTEILVNPEFDRSVFSFPRMNDSAPQSNTGSADDPLSSPLSQ